MKMAPFKRSFVKLKRNSGGLFFILALASFSSSSLANDLNSLSLSEPSTKVSGKTSSPARKSLISAAERQSIILTGPMGMKMNLSGRIDTYDESNNLKTFSTDEGYQEFLKEISQTPLSKRMNFYEMGVNSNNAAIFYHSIEEILIQRHFPGIPILKALLDRAKDLETDNRILVYTVYKKLIYWSSSTYKRPSILEEIFLRDSPVLYTELIQWAIYQLGEVGNMKHINALRPLKSHPELEQSLKVTEEKLKFNSQHPDKVSRFIAATRSETNEIRYWALDHLTKLEDIRVAHYLRLLFEQTNLHFGQREFDLVQQALETHHGNFPNLYSSLEIKGPWSPPEEAEEKQKAAQTDKE